MRRTCGAKSTIILVANGTNVELVCTENNSDVANPGKQSVSLVNGLYKADSLGQLMQTEFNGLFWHDFRDGAIEYHRQYEFGALWLAALWRFRSGNGNEPLSDLLHNGT